MVNSKKVIATLGVVAGLGTSVLPLASYATDPADVTKTIRATVNEYFTLSVDSNTDMESETGTVTLDVNDTDSSLIHTVNVTGNVYGGYDLKLGSKTSSTSLLFVADKTKAVGVAERYNSSINIPSSTSVAAGTSAWGYKTSGTQTFSGDWVTIKASGSEDTIYTNENTSNSSFNDTRYVNYGISTSASQAAGVYEGQVVYSATARI